MKKEIMKINFNISFTLTVRAVNDTLTCCNPLMRIWISGLQQKGVKVLP